MLAINALTTRIRTAGRAARGFAFLRELGPYFAIELLLPGGSLIALLLWLYSRHKSGKPFLPLRLRVSTSRSAPLIALPEFRGTISPYGRRAARALPNYRETVTFRATSELRNAVERERQ